MDNNFVKREIRNRVIAAEKGLFLLNIYDSEGDNHDFIEMIRDTLGEVMELMDKLE